MDMKPQRGCAVAAGNVGAEAGPFAVPRAILFDWDNTLIDSWPCIIRAMNATLETMGHRPWSEAECRARIARSLRDAFPDLFGDRWQEARDVFYDVFSAIHLEMLTPLPGAERMLDTLAQRGIYLGVVSNKTGAYLRAEAEHLGWTRFFGRLVGAGDAARDKPAPDPVHMALDGAAVPAGEDVWFVGDNLVDMQCAVDSGCPAILLHPDPPRPEVFAACPPRLIFRGCEDFLQFVRKLPVPKPDER